MADGNVVKLGRRQKAIGLAFLVLGILALRLTVPVSLEGDWMGSLTKCACNHLNLVRFHDGHVTWFGHGGEPSKLTDWGTYRQVGWNTFEWSSAKHPITTVRVGWFFTSYEGGFLKSNEIIYCWRYPFASRANKLYQQCEEMTQPREKQPEI